MDKTTSIRYAVDKLIDSDLNIKVKLTILDGIFALIEKEGLNDKLRVETLSKFAEVHLEYMKVMEELEAGLRAMGNGDKIILKEHIR